MNSSYKKCLSYMNQLSISSISVFVGAGLSKPCGMPDWSELVKSCADDIGLDMKSEPYPRILQYSLGKKASYSIFCENLKQQQNKCQPQVAQRLIARLGLPRIWTTNYDGLLEQAYADECIPYQIVAEDKDLYFLNYQHNRIIKMHGSLTSEKTTDIVLLESEYENFALHRKGILHLLENEIRTKSILYLGFSFDDPNIRRIVSSIWNVEQPGHPSFLFTVPPVEEAEKIRYKCWKDDLERYNIIVVELDEYSQINAFLYEMLEKRFGKTVLLIGKRDDDDYHDYAYQIGYQLAKAGYKIHSGGGPHVAQSIASGAWDYLSQEKIALDDKVVFYYRYHGGSTNPKKGQIIYCGETRSEVRQKMITSDKICLLIGDKPPSENGIQEEINIAYKKGARLLAVGSSGALAKKNWETELPNYSLGGCFADKETVYQTINSDVASPDEVAKAVVELADYLLVRNYEK